MFLLGVLLLGAVLCVGVRWHYRTSWRRAFAFSLKLAFVILACALIGLWLFGVVMRLIERVQG
jgi:hypothetical protein